jgi:hypothetical protein
MGVLIFWKGKTYPLQSRPFHTQKAKPRMLRNGKEKMKKQYRRREERRST